MGVFVYTLFGTSKDVTLGPTAILSLITASAIGGCSDKVACAALLTLICGLIQLTMGILNLGTVYMYVWCLIYYICVLLLYMLESGIYITFIHVHNEAVYCTCTVLEVCLIAMQCNYDEEEERGVESGGGKLTP